MSHQHPHIGSVPHQLYDDDGNVTGEVVLMPAPDIGAIGKHRSNGVAWICGDFVEVCVTTSHYLTGVGLPDNEGIGRPPETADSIAKRCAMRAKKQIRRICNTNRMRYMWTLTMCPGNSEYADNYPNPVCTITQRHYKSMRDLWKRFARKLRTQFNNPPWLAVFELHDSDKTSEEKRGTYHIHFATNVVLDWAAVGKAWGHGNVRFDDFGAAKSERGGEVRNPGAYLSKYVGKSFDVHNAHHKRYTRSSNTLLPQKIAFEDVETILSRGSKEVYRAQKEFDFVDNVTGYAGIYGVWQITYKLNKKEKMT